MPQLYDFPYAPAQRVGELTGKAVGLSSGSANTSPDASNIPCQEFETDLWSGGLVVGVCR